MLLKTSKSMRAPSGRPRMKHCQIIKDIQIDYLSQFNNSEYKIILFKIKQRKEEAFFINFLLEINQNKRILYIEKLDFLIQSFGICLDSTFLYHLLIFLKKIKPEVENAFVFRNLNEVLDTYLVDYSLNTAISEINTENKIYIK